MLPVRTSPTRGPGRAQMLALATAAGLAAALVAYFGLARQTQGAAGPAERSVAVVVAAGDLPARRLLAPALLRVQRLSPSEAPAGSVAAPEDLAGQVTTAPIAAGQPVTRDRVTALSTSPGIAGSVTPGHRAVSVALDPESGVAGFLEPGDHVDVLATVGGSSGQATTRTILQDARLLALGSRTGTAPSNSDSGDPSEKPATSATLEVTPPEAEALALAAARGKLQLALRGFEDTAQAPVAALPSPTEMAPSAPNSGGAGRKTTRPHLAPPELGVGGPSEPPSANPRRSVRPPATPTEVAPATPTPITVIRGTETTTVTLGE